MKKKKFAYLNVGTTNKKTQISLLVTVSDGRHNNIVPARSPRIICSHCNNISSFRNLT